MRAAGPFSGAYVLDADRPATLYTRRRHARASWRRTRSCSPPRRRSTGSAPRARSRPRSSARRLPNRTASVRGDLYLRGGGDPTFGSPPSPSAPTAAAAHARGARRAVKRAGVERVTGRVLGDESLFDSLRGGPDSGYGVSIWVGPLARSPSTAASAQRERQRVPAQPAGVRGQAADARARAQRASACAASRRGGRGAGAAPRDRRGRVAHGRPLPLTNQASDNFFAEMLAKHLDATAPARARPRGGARGGRAFARRARRAAPARGRLGPRARQPGRAARGRAPAARRCTRDRVRPPSTTRCRSPAGRNAARPRCASGPRAAAAGQDRHDQRRLRAVGLLPGRARGDMIAFSFLMNGVLHPSAPARLQDGWRRRSPAAIRKHG